MTGKKLRFLLPAVHSLEFNLSLFKGTEDHKLFFLIVKSQNHAGPDCLNVCKSM